MRLEMAIKRTSSQLSRDRRNAPLEDSIRTYKLLVTRWHVQGVLLDAELGVEIMNLIKRNPTTSSSGEYQ